jgi:hypothetical protein
MSVAPFVGFLRKNSSCRWLTAGCLLVSGLLAGCGPAVHYSGASFPRTRFVDIYSSRSGIKKSFIVMGHTDQQSYAAGKEKTIRDKIVAEAKKRGADAVLITEADLHDNDASETMPLPSPGVQTDPADNQPQARAIETRDPSMRSVHAEFLKYR